MGIIKWLNSHAIPATIFYFALMGGIAWGVNQSIADRTPLEAMPADGDLIAIYDLDATAGKSIAVSTFRGDNLNAIVNAATGVTDPTIMMYDSSDDDGTAKIKGTSVGGDTVHDIVMSFYVDVAGDETEFLQLDGINGTVDVLKPLNAPSINAGTTWTTVSQVSTPYNAETLEGDKCNHIFYMSAAATDDVEIDLPSTGLCDTGQGKTLRFVNLDDASDLYLDPADGEADTIFDLAGTCVAGARYRLDQGEWALLHGVSATLWRVAGGTGACE